MTGMAVVAGAALAALTAPLYADLALCLAGNLFLRRKRPGPEAREIRLAVVVPAHNEETMVAATVRSLKAAAGQTPVYVVAHNCEDRTAREAETAGATVLELNNPGLLGKGAALRHGFAAAFAAGANAVLVVDADSTVSANLAEASRAALAGGAEITQCRYELSLPEENAMALHRLKALAFRGMNVLRPRGRAGLGLSTGLFGNGFALTREALERVPFAVDGITEDAEYHGRAVAAGLKVEWLGEARVSSTQPGASWVRAAQEARWEGGRVEAGRRSAGRLLRAAARGNWQAVETLADQFSLPLARGVLLLALVALTPCLGLRLYAAACGLATVLYALGSALLGEEPGRDLAALAAAPLYIVWKIAITPLVVRQAGRRARWTSTAREGKGR